MPLFLAESPVLPAGDALDGACADAKRLADHASGIAHVRTTLLPGGEAVLHLFEAPSVAALATAGDRAGLVFRSIVGATTTVPEERS